MIQLNHLTKRFGATLAVDDLSFQVRPGIVTGFLGPNGAGKSTTMRMILGLDQPTSGQALIGGVPYRTMRDPLRTVGALLDAKDLHGGRTARAHLLALAYSNGIPRDRVQEVLDLTGLAQAASRRIKEFSLGMSQRLGIAAALLGDPQVLMFDEPVNGLDPEGILWIRTFMRQLAAQGRTVLVSSHLMSEMALTADHLIVIGRGKLLADTSITDFIHTNSQSHVQIRVSDPDLLARVLGEHGKVWTRVEQYLQVPAVTTDEIGRLAMAHHITVLELVEQKSSLEAAFMEMTKSSADYRSAALTEDPPVAGPAEAESATQEARV